MAVKQWWSDYEKDPSAAVGKLTNMMIEACGLAERLPLEAFGEDDDTDVDDYIAGLVERCTSGKARDEEEASAVTGASVFAKKDKASKKVRANFCDFWDKFVDNAPEEGRAQHLALARARALVVLEVALAVGAVAELELARRGVGDEVALHEVVHEVVHVLREAETLVVLCVNDRSRQPHAIDA